MPGKKTPGKKTEVKRDRNASDGNRPARNPLAWNRPASNRSASNRSAWNRPNRSRSETQPDRSPSSPKQGGVRIGAYNRLTVEGISDHGIHLISGEDRMVLPDKYLKRPVSAGDQLDLFVYTDSQDRLVATRLKPAGVVGEFVFLVAKDVVPFGAFMDWGLEKDLLVPRDEQQERMMPGKKYLVKICRDDRVRKVYGTTKISANCEKDTGDLKVGQPVDLMVHTVTPTGIMAIVNHRYYGRIRLHETSEKLFVADTCKGYITRIRENGKLDLALKKPGHTSVPKSAQVILYRLNQSGGFIPCHDKSSPEEIGRRFSMSKKEFKRAVGSLYKKRLITLEHDGIRLAKEASVKTDGTR